MTGIEVRLVKALVKDNGTTTLGGIFPGLASMYLLVIVVSDLENPVQNLDLKGFAKVGDNEELPIDRTVFLWQDNGDGNAPSQIHVYASILKSKQGLRDVAQAMQKVKGDSNYKDLVTTISSLVSSGTPIGAISDAIFSIASIVGEYLGDVKDKPWITMVQSFTGLNGDWDNVGSAMRGVENERAALTLKLIVRDKDRT